MAVTIVLNTIAIGLSHFAGQNAERHDLEQVVLGFSPVPVFVKKDSFVISQSADAAELVFNGVPNGTHRFCIRGADGKLKWRSSSLETTTGYEKFSFMITQVPLSEVTFGAEDLKNQIGDALPITEDIPGLDEDLNITEIDIRLKSDHIDLEGEGNIAKGDDWTILKSTFEFDYDFTLQPARDLDKKKLLRVAPEQPLSLNLSNLITGVGVACMEKEINNKIRETVEKLLNKKIDDRMRAAIGARFAGNQLTEQITATVIDVNTVEAGTTSVEISPGVNVPLPIRKLQFIIDVSIPSGLISTGKSGCMGAGALVFITLFGLLFLS